VALIWAWSVGVLCWGSNALRPWCLAVLARDNVVTNQVLVSPNARSADLTAAFANHLAVASFPDVTASEARSVPPEDGFFAFLVFDAVCSLSALSRIRFTVCHEPRLIGCLIRMLQIVNRKSACVGCDPSSLLSFVGR
jgi:hypothetical protein